jgi:hypothetical protein
VGAELCGETRETREDGGGVARQDRAGIQHGIPTARVRCDESMTPGLSSLVQVTSPSQRLSALLLNVPVLVACGSPLLLNWHHQWPVRFRQDRWATARRPYVLESSFHSTTVTHTYRKHSAPLCLKPFPVVPVVPPGTLWKLGRLLWVNIEPFEVTGGRVVCSRGEH